MKKISEGLWQASAMKGFDLPDEADVVGWFCGGPVTHLDREIEVLYFTIPDCAEGLDPFDFARMMVLADEVKDRNVVSVCSAGENRSGLFSTLVLIARGYEVEDATQTVQENGPHNSKDRPHSFWNPGFAAQVRRFFLT